MISWEILDSRTVSQEQIAQALQTADNRRKQKAAALLREQDRRVTICSDLLLRRLLSARLRCPPESLEFTVAENGKPCLAGNPLCFNLSHSGPYAACAVSEHSVGMDIECFRPVSAALIKRVCSPGELAFVGDDAQKFIQLWTLKEACLKYRGTGIAGDLKQVVAVHGGQLSLLELSFFSGTSADYAFSIVYEL